jgi:hypothetical protein
VSDDWRAAKCLVVLHDQLDAAHPDRPKGSDGMVASAAHHKQNPDSDHEPRDAPKGATDQRPVVCAYDITTAPWLDELAEALRAAGAAGDERIKYVIWRRRITSAAHGWQWAPYKGKDPHTGHLHLSVSADPHEYDRTDPWPLSRGHVSGHAAVAPEPITTQEDCDMRIIYATGRPTVLVGVGVFRPLPSNKDVDAHKAAGIPVAGVTPDQHDRIIAAAS